MNPEQKRIKERSKQPSICQTCKHLIKVEECVDAVMGISPYISGYQTCELFTYIPSYLSNGPNFRTGLFECNKYEKVGV